MSVGQESGHRVGIESVVVAANRSATIDQDDPGAVHRRPAPCGSSSVASLNPLLDQAIDRFLITGEEAPAARLRAEFRRIIAQ